ncbi:MAG: hypothetical protein C4297_09160 [Gemmataceae bacterium]
MPTPNVTRNLRLWNSCLGLLVIASSLCLTGSLSAGLVLDAFTQTNFSWPQSTTSSATFNDAPITGALGNSRVLVLTSTPPGENISAAVFTGPFPGFEFSAGVGGTGTLTMHYGGVGGAGLNVNLAAMGLDTIKLANLKTDQPGLQIALTISDGTTSQTQTFVDNTPGFVLHDLLLPLSGFSTSLLSNVKSITFIFTGPPGIDFKVGQLFIMPEPAAWLVWGLVTGAAVGAYRWKRARTRKSASLA